MCIPISEGSQVWLGISVRQRTRPAPYNWAQSSNLLRMNSRARLHAGPAHRSVAQSAEDELQGALALAVGYPALAVLAQVHAVDALHAVRPRLDELRVPILHLHRVDGIPLLLQGRVQGLPPRLREEDPRPAVELALLVDPETPELRVPPRRHWHRGGGPGRGGRDREHVGAHRDGGQGVPRQLARMGAAGVSELGLLRILPSRDHVVEVHELALSGHGEGHGRGRNHGRPLSGTKDSPLQGLRRGAASSHAWLGGEGLARRVRRLA
mmetsp:Transcript_10004/g.21966  ORF Transcript_10004/g.21966 Transcript_10004/m.21966 type:complete len:267 (+) Transcript_10004:13-813(+)